jgi:site-specific DNA recombinase
MTTHFIYCRKSSEAEDKQILSIESQERELSSYAEREGLNVIKVFKEEKTAHKRGRVVFGQLLDELEQYKAHGLLVWQPNRLARNAYDGGWLITAMDEGWLKEIRTPFKTYQNTPEDKFFLQLEFGMAKKDSDDKSVNVKRGLRAKVALGWRPGIAPIGYLNDKMKDRGARDILIDPQRFPLVRKIFDLFLTGSYSVYWLSEIANNEWGLRTRESRKMGGKPLSVSHIYRILTDPFYYGEFYWSGELIKGGHRPMITVTEYDNIQNLLGRKGRPRPKSHIFAFLGLIRCGECGASITAEEKRQVICSQCRLKFSYLNRDDCPRCSSEIERMTDPVFLHYVYYRCTKKRLRKCSQPYVTSKDLENQIDNILALIEVSPEFKDWVLQVLRDNYKSENATHQSVSESLTKTYNDVQARLRNLLALKLSPLNGNGGLLSDEEYSQQKSVLVQEKNRLEEKLRDQGQSFEDWMRTCGKAFDFAVHARCKFAEGGWEVKRAILRSIGSNLTLLDKKVLIKLPNPIIEGLENTVKECPDASPNFGTLEPRKHVDFIGEVARFDAAIPNLLRTWNDVRTYWLSSYDPMTWYIFDFILDSGRDSVEADTHALRKAA